jgi:hypothetical protein
MRFTLFDVYIPVKRIVAGEELFLDYGKGYFPEKDTKEAKN